MAADSRPKRSSVRPDRQPLQWILIAAIAAGVLAHGLATLQPVFSDEFLILGNFWDFVQNRTIIPEHARYPSLYSYMTAPFTGAVALASILSGLPPSIYDFSEWMAYRPLVAIWPARLVSFIAWAVCGWAVYLIALETLRDRLTALAGAAAFASAIGTLQYTGYGLPDTTMMMWAALALLFATRMMGAEDPTRYALITGLLAGLAVATKYSAVAIALPLLAAILMSERQGKAAVALLGHVAVAALVGFLIGSPGWIVAPERFIEGLAWERAHMARGHLGYMGVPVLGQIELLARADLPLMILAVAGAAVWGVRRSGREFIVFIVAVVAVIAMTAPARKQSLHYLFVLYPVAAVLVAGGLASVGGRARRGGALLVALVCLGSAVGGLWWGYRAAVLPDSLEVSREWINARVPDDAIIAMDWIDVPRLVSEQEVSGLREDLRTDFVRDVYAGLRTFPTVEIDYATEFLLATEADWLVTSSTAYARFFKYGRFTGLPPAPDDILGTEFALRRSFYENLKTGLAGWRLEHEVYTGHGPTVRIYRRG